MTGDMADSEDREQLRHEILRLRDQALGAEARNQFLTDRIANQDDRITGLEEQVEEWKGRVAERDARIAERDASIAERDANIAQKDTRIGEKDARIAELEAENHRLNEKLTRPAIIRLVRRIAGRS